LQGPRAPAAAVVDPVIAVRRHPELAEPLEEKRGRRVHGHAAIAGGLRALDVLAARVGARARRARCPR